MLKHARRFILRILQDTEDNLSDDSLYKVDQPRYSRPATLDEIRDNHLYHLGLAVNGLHVRVGRLEAKTALILAFVSMLVGLAIGPFIEHITRFIVRGF